MKENKDKAEIHYEKGIKHRKKEDFKSALIEFIRAEELGLKTTDIYKTISFIYSFDENYKKAEEYIEKGLKIDPSNSYFYYLKGINSKNLNKHKESLKYLLTAVKLGFSTNELIDLISETYNERNQIENYIEFIDNWLKEEPNNAYLYYVKGRNWQALKNYQNAVMEFLKAEKLGLKEERLFAEIAYSYREISDFKNSNKYFDICLKIKPDNAYLYYIKGYNCRNLKENEKALKSFLLSEKLGFKDDDLYINIAYHYGIKRNTKESQRYIDKAIKLNPKDGYYYYLKGTNYKDLNNDTKAIYWLKKAEKLGYKTEYIYEQIIYYYCHRENLNYKKALEYIEKAKKGNYYSDYLKYMETSILLEKKEYKKAFELFNSLLNSYIDNEENNTWIATIFFLCKDFTSAKYYIEKIKEDKKTYEFNYLKNNIYSLKFHIEYELKNYDKALNIYRKNKLSEPSIYAALSHLFMIENKFNKALYFLKKIDEKKNKEIIIQLKGDLYFYKNDYDKALEYYNELIKTKKTSKNLFENLITIYESKKDNASVTKYKKKMNKLIKEEETLKELKEKYLNI